MPSAAARVAVDFEHFGGLHADSTAVKNLLAHAGVVDPRSGEPLSEALVLGIAGGIGAGYAFCPSVPRHGLGGGIAVVARHDSADYAGRFHGKVFERLGVKVDVAEATTAKAAHRKLVGALEGGEPALIWCGRSLSYDRADAYSWCAGGLSGWAAVVYGVDEARGVAQLADVAAGPVEATLESLHAARGAVCTHKRRMLTVARAPKLSAATLKQAVRAGLRDCVGELRKPRMKTYSLAGLVQLARMMPNDRNQAGWLKAYPGGKLWWPLKDLYVSIEAESRGGGLMRPFFAEFLDDAAGLLGRNALRASAREYRELGAQWTAFAEAALPDRIAAFKKLKGLLRKVPALLRDKGAKGLKQRDLALDRLDGLERSVMKQFPLAPAAARAHLEQLSERVFELHAAECEALDALAAAVK